MSIIRINWGARVALLYVGFVLLIVSLVIGSMQQQFDLVSDQYYEEELKFQEVIEAGRNQAALSEPVHLELEEAAIHLKFPEEFRGKTISGKVEFYAPVSARNDRRFDIQTGPDRSMDISSVGFQSGEYTVRIRWESDGRSYYQETKLNISQ